MYSQSRGDTMCLLILIPRGLFVQRSLPYHALFPDVHKHVSRAGRMRGVARSAMRKAASESLQPTVVIPKLNIHEKEALGPLRGRR